MIIRMLSVPQLPQQPNGGHTIVKISPSWCREESILLKHIGVAAMLTIQSHQFGLSYVVCKYGLTWSLSSNYFRPLMKLKCKQVPRTQMSCPEAHVEMLYCATLKPTSPLYLLSISHSDSIQCWGQASPSCYFPSKYSKSLVGRSLQPCLSL